MNTQKNSQTSIGLVTAADSKYFREVASAAMFENEIESAGTSIQPLVGGAPVPRGAEVQSLKGSNHNMIKTLGGIGVQSSEESDDDASPHNNNMVMKISVSNKNLDNIRGQNCTPDKEIEQIRDKLCQSPLNQVFSKEYVGIEEDSAANDVNLVKEKTQMKLPEGQEQDSIINPLDNEQKQKQFENWQPVVCRQTQQFLDSTDQTQKSEYKHFTGNILRNKKQIIAHNYKRQQSRQRNNSQLRTSYHIVPKELSSSLMSVNGQKCLKIKELEFQPLLRSSPKVAESPATKTAVNEVSSKFASRVTFQDGSIKNKYQPHESLTMAKLKKPVLLNSSSEFKGLELVHNATELTNLNASSDYTHHLAPKMDTNPNTAQKSTAKGVILLRQNNCSSQINVNSAMMDDSRKGDDNYKNDSVSNLNGMNTTEEDQMTNHQKLQQIKVPNVPKNEHDVDFLTEGSEHKQAVTAQGRVMINFDASIKVMNKTAFMRDSSPNKSPTMQKRPFGQGGFTPPPSQGISDFMQVVSRRKLPSKHDHKQVAESDKGLSKDLLSVVQQSKGSVPRKSLNQSPLLPEKKKKILPKLNFQGNKTCEHLDSKVTSNAASGQRTSEIRQKSVQITTLRKESHIEDMESTFGGLRGFTRKEESFDKDRESNNEIINIDKKPPQLSLKNQATKPRKAALAIRNEFVLTSKDKSFSKSPTQQQSNTKDEKNNSIIVKSVQVTDSGQKLNMIRSAYKEKKMNKQETITNAKKKALDIRLQNVLSFSNAIEPLMNVQPAPIKSRLTQVADGGNSPLRLASSISFDANHGLLYQAMLSSKEATTDDATISPIKIIKQTSPTAGKYISPLPGALANTAMTITIEMDTALDNKSPPAPTEEKSPQKPVKVRLFDIGGIGDPRPHALILQQSSLASPSIFYEERDRLNPSKLSHTSQLKPKKQPVSKGGAVTPSVNIKSLNKSQELVEVVSKVVGNNNMNRSKAEPEEQPSQQLMLQNRINTSHIREQVHTASSAASRSKSKTGSTAALNKLAKTSYHLYQKFSTSSRRQSAIRADYNSSVSPMKQVLRDSKQSEDQIMRLETFSNDTKYFNKSKRQSGVADLVSLHDSKNPEGSPVQQIKVVELSHLPQVNTDYMDFPGQSIMTHEDSIMRQTQTQTQVDQLQKYFRLTTFIDEMFKKKESMGNPVQSKNRSQPRMKKHTGWNKVLMGVKSNTPAVSRFEPINNRYLSPAKIQNVESRLQQGTTERRGQAFKSQPKSPKHPFINQTFRNIHRSPVQKVMAPDFLKSNTARLHPFYHSLVTQNFEKLSQKLNMDEEDCMLLGVPFEHLYAQPKTGNKGTQSSQDQAGTINIQAAAKHELHDNAVDQGVATQLLANPRTSQVSRNNESTSFQMRSQLSPIHQRPNQVSQLRNHGKISISGHMSVTSSHNQLHTQQQKLQQSSVQQQLAESALLIQANGQEIHDDEQQLMVSGENKLIRVSSSGSNSRLLVQTSGKVSPLMDKSRQQKQGNESQQQLIAHGAELQQKVVRTQVVHRNAQKNSTTNSIVYRQLSKGALAANTKVWSVVKKHNDSSQRHSSTMVGRNISAVDNINEDLAMIKSTESKAQQHEIDALNASSRFREMRLPPVKVKTAIVCGCSHENLPANNSNAHGGDADRDSPLLDSIFPVLSPTQQNYHHSINQNKSIITATEGLKTSKAPKQLVFMGKSRVQHQQKALTTSNINSHKKNQIA